MINIEGCVIKKDYHVVSFSGGKDSTAMLLFMIENGYHIDEIIFLDTGMEFPEVYDNINKVEKHINFPITRLKADKDWEYYMFKHKKLKGKKGETVGGGNGYSWPDFINRWCTTLFKTNIIIKYLKQYEKQYNIIQYIGIAYDEENRIKDKPNTIYPLYENKMTEKDCLQYCIDRGFNWNGLYNYFSRLSCWCCPLKNLKELKILWKHFPQYWNTLKEWDKNTYRKFKYTYTVQELEDKFIKEEKESNN